jgi:hypothetical protein
MRDGLRRNCLRVLNMDACRGGLESVPGHVYISPALVSRRSIRQATETRRAELVASGFWRPAFHFQQLTTPQRLDHGLAPISAPRHSGGPERKESAHCCLSRSARVPGGGEREKAAIGATGGMRHGRTFRRHAPDAPWWKALGGIEPVRRRRPLPALLLTSRELHLGEIVPN